MRGITCALISLTYWYMGRETPCLYYICAGQCSKGKAADHNHYCQHCDKYRPRTKVRHIN